MSNETKETIVKIINNSEIYEFMIDNISFYEIGHYLSLFINMNETYDSINIFNFLFLEYMKESNVSIETIKKKEKNTSNQYIIHFSINEKLVISICSKYFSTYYLTIEEFTTTVKYIQNINDTINNYMKMKMKNENYNFTINDIYFLKHIGSHMISFDDDKVFPEDLLELKKLTSF